MRTAELVLQEKIPEGRDRKFLVELDERLREISSGLIVSLRLMGLTKYRLPRLQVSGDDEEAFLEILRRSFGIGPKSLQDLLDQPIWKGFVKGPSDQMNTLLIDIGLEDPPFLVMLRAERLRAQLFDGVRISLQSMIAKYGLLEDFPLELRTTSYNEADRKVEVDLSDPQRERFQEWLRLPFDRITIQNVLYSEVMNVLRETGLDRDIAAVESLSFGTHSLVCKLGTDGRGLVRRLGSQLKAAKLHVFHPDSGDRDESRAQFRDINLKSKSANIRAPQHTRRSGRNGTA